MVYMDPKQYEAEAETLDTPRHEDFGSGAYADIAEAYDQDAELLAANMGWD